MSKLGNPCRRVRGRSSRRDSHIPDGSLLEQHFGVGLDGGLAPLWLRREPSHGNGSTGRWYRMRWSCGHINHVGTGFDTKVVAILGRGHPYTGPRPRPNRSIGGTNGSGTQTRLICNADTPTRRGRRRRRHDDKWDQHKKQPKPRQEFRTKFATTNTRFAGTTIPETGNSGTLQEQVTETPQDKVQGESTTMTSKKKQ